MASAVQTADSGVWEEAAAQDEAAVAALYHQFVPSLTSYARRRGAEDPEGMANLAFFRGIRALPNLRNRNAPVFRAYLYRIVRNQIAGQYSQPVVSRIPLATGFEFEQLQESEPSPEEQVASDSGFETLLEALTPEQREVFQHRFGAGHTIAETARILERTPAAIHGLQERGLRKLRFLAAIAALVLCAGVAWLSSLRTTSVVDLPADEGPSVSTPVDEQRDDGEDNETPLQVIDGDEVRMRVEVEDQSAPPESSESSAPSESTVVGAEQAIPADTVDTSPTAVTMPGSVMRPASATHMCLGYNQELSLMELQDCRDTLDQRWELRPSSVDGYYELAVLSTGQCMYVDGFSTEEHARIIGSACGSEVDNGLWEFSGGPTFGYDGAPLLARHSDKCITVEGNSRHEGAVVSQRGCGLAMYQVFSYGT